VLFPEKKVTAILFETSVKFVISTWRYTPKKVVASFAEMWVIFSSSSLKIEGTGSSEKSVTLSFQLGAIFWRLYNEYEPLLETQVSYIINICKFLIMRFHLSAQTRRLTCFSLRTLSLKLLSYLMKADVCQGLQVFFALNVMKTLWDWERLSLVLTQWRDITSRVT
jgi:hypothetical protein